MHSSFLEAEDKVAQAKMPTSLQLNDKGAKLVCEKVSDSDFVQGCDLHLQYALKQQVDLAQLSVKCSAELVATSRKGQFDSCTSESDTGSCCGGQRCSVFNAYPDEGGCVLPVGCC